MRPVQADRCEAGKDCCALRILEDFANEISLLEQVVCEAGHQVSFIQNFTEFNYIEYYWATVKRYTRENFKNLSLQYLLHWIQLV